MSESVVTNGSDSGLATLVSNYRRLSAQSVPLVMATVIETLGSTYRKAGARMLISRDGQFHGLIGGGCFEGDLYEHTQAVFADGEPRMLFYDMRATEEDAIWGLGLGCNGAVRILLQRLTADGADPTIERLASILERDSPAVLATICDSDAADTSYDLSTSGQRSIGDAAAGALQAGAASVATLEQPVLREETINGREVTVFYDYIRPAPRLLLIGAGADAQPILNLARQLDWRVVIADHRPAYARAERFPGAEQVLQTEPDSLRPQLEDRRINAVVLMTHNINVDARFLEVLQDLPCQYLGMLGPASRHDQLFSMTGIDPAIFGQTLHAPVGLDIGGASPESIAMSLITEIHAVLHDRDARPLHGKRQPIKSREPAN